MRTGVEPITSVGTLALVNAFMELYTVLIFFPNLGQWGPIVGVALAALGSAYASLTGGSLLSSFPMRPSPSELAHADCVVGDSPSELNEGVESRQRGTTDTLASPITESSLNGAERRERTTRSRRRVMIHSCGHYCYCHDDPTNAARADAAIPINLVRVTSPVSIQRTHTDSSTGPLITEASAPDTVSLRISQRILKFSQWIGTPKVEDMEDMRKDQNYTQYPLVPGERARNTRLFRGDFGAQRSRVSLGDERSGTRSENSEYTPGQLTLNIPGRATSTPIVRSTNPVAGPSSSKSRSKTTPNGNEVGRYGSRAEAGSSAGSSRPGTSTSANSPPKEQRRRPSNHTPKRSSGASVLSPIPQITIYETPEENTSGQSGFFPPPTLPDPLASPPLPTQPPEKTTQHHRSRTEPPTSPTPPDNDTTID